MERVALMQALLPSAKSFDNTVHLSPELGFIYFSNPIVACSTMKATLNSATARALGLPQPGLQLDQIHDRAANPLKRPSDIGLSAFAAMLDDPAVRKISVIRDPRRRFMSCFGKKLMRENRITERLRSHLKIPAGALLSKALTPDSFIAALEADARLLNMNDHWRPQRRQVFYDLVPDLCLGRVESLAQDVDWLLTPIFGAGGFDLIDVTALSPQNSSRGREVPALSDAGIEAVGRVYAGDAQMLAEVTKAAPAVDDASRPAAPVRVPPATAPLTAPPWQPPVPDPARPQLIVHVGMAGTGTGAIAAALAAAGPHLAAHSTIDLGPTPLIQRKITLEDALPLPADMLADLGAAWADRLASFAAGAGALRLIVSNAALGAHPQAMAALLTPLQQRFAVRLVIFARNPHAWLPAAALSGAALSGAGWAGPAGPQPLPVLLRQYRHLIDWLRLMPDAVEIHTCRADSDMIDAAGAVFGIDLPRPAAAGGDVDHSDADPSDPASAVVTAMLAARAGHGAHLPPRRHGPVLTLEQSLRAAPSGAQIAAAIADNIGIFDAITEAGGPDLLALGDVAPPMPALEAVRTRLLEVLAGLTVDLAARIAALEARVVALEVPPSRPGRKA